MIQFESWTKKPVLLAVHAGTTIQLDFQVVFHRKLNKLRWLEHALNGDKSILERHIFAMKAMQGNTDTLIFVLFTSRE